LKRLTRHRCWQGLGVTALVLAASAGVGTAALADVTIDDAQVEEGDSGTVNMTFTVTADNDDGTVEYTTTSGSALEGADFEATSGFLFFSSPGVEEIVVPVIGDTAEENDETFSVVLEYGSASAFRVDDLEGVGTIIDDEDDGGGSGSPPPLPPRDSDGDGVPDFRDVCPAVFGATPSGCPDPGSGQDSDADGVPNATDSCPLVTGSEPNGCPAGGMLPPPALGSTVNLFVLQDDVFIKLPPGFARVAADGADVSRRRPGFVPLVDPRQVPVGSLIDTEDGRVRLVSATDFRGGTQSGNFAGGLFKIRQARRARAKTVLQLRGSSFRRCQAVGSAAVAAAAQRRRVSARTLRRLTGNAKGRFRTRGRHSAATIRGTVWSVSDRCDGTLTRVRRGRVRVRDFRRARTITVRAGESYLARP
jgi:hypothetical protein